MEPLDVISKYFWLLALIVTVINALLFRKRAESCIDKDPQRAGEYAALFRGYIIWLNLPWVVMGLGCTVGGVPSLWHYFQPKDGNPYILAWFGSLLFLWGLGTFWLFCRNGAQVLASHPGAVALRYGFESKHITDPVLIKVIWLLMLAGGIVVVAAMWFADIPKPSLR